jgi:hypothetical protein
MEFVKPNALLNANGTSYALEIDIAYRTIVKLFGLPNGDHDGYKVDAEWVIETPDGVATIYNYKTGRNYLGKDAPATSQIRDWHIGAKDIKAAKWVHVALEVANRFTNSKK